MQVFEEFRDEFALHNATKYLPDDLEIATRICVCMKSLFLSSKHNGVMTSPARRIGYSNILQYLTKGLKKYVYGADREMIFRYCFLSLIYNQFQLLAEGWETKGTHGACKHRAKLNFVFKYYGSTREKVYVEKDSTFHHGSLESIPKYCLALLQITKERSMPT